MSYAEKRGKKMTGQWYGEIPAKGDRPRMRKRFGTKAEADLWEAHVKVHGEEPGWATDGKGPQDSFAELARACVEAGGIKGRWHRKDTGRPEKALTRVCELGLGKVPITSVNYGAVEDIVGKLRKLPGQRPGSTMSGATINRYLAAISVVLDYAERKGKIDRAPKLPWQDEPKARKAVYTREEIDLLIGALRAQGNDTEAFLVAVLAVTGMRVGELLGILPRQVDVLGFVRLDDPGMIKNDECRSCWIGAPAARHLRGIIDASQMPTYRNLWAIGRDAMKSVGMEVIPRWLHTIRHTTATWTVRAEKDLQVAQQMLGHRDINTTLGYRHIPDEVIEERGKALLPHRGNSTLLEAIFLNDSNGA